MGTSKSFSDARHTMVPNWGDLSSSMTSNCDSSTVSPVKLQNILNNYVSSLGGASIAGRGGSKVGGKGGIRTAKKLGAFFGAFTSSGSIREALKTIGLTDLNEKTVAEIINYLIEYCSGTASTIDETAAKEASRQLLEELISSANDVDEIEQLLSDKFNVNTSEDLIIKYFGYYMFEHLSRWFYEHLIKSKSESECNNLFRQIKEFIFERVLTLHKTNPLQDIDWSSASADTVIKNIQQDVLTVFE